MRYDVPTEFEIIAVSTSASKGPHLRAQLHAATVIDGGRFLFRTEPALWEHNLRYQLQHTAGANPADLDAATLKLSSSETARFKVTCSPQSLIDMGFSGVNRVY